jgi:protein Mpv17
MNSVSLLGNGLKQVWSAYERQLERRPIMTQMTTSFLLWGSGDLIAQRLERWEQQQKKITQQQLMQQQHQGKKQGAVAGPPPGSSLGSSSSSEPDSGYDMRRAFFTAMFGATFVGPVGHFWYQAIDRWCRAWVPKGGPAFIATKVLLDTAVMGPFYVAGKQVLFPPKPSQPHSLLLI